MSSTTPLSIPASKSTVRVSVIDTTMRSHLPASIFMGPPIHGFDMIRAPSYSFLITHKDDKTGAERKLVFDLGLPVDLEKDFPPAVYQQFTAMAGAGMMKSKRYVNDILEGEDVKLESIEGVVWSHAHGDHVGRPSLFPASTSLIVGPGVQQAYFPGWPDVEESPVLAREFQGRDVLGLDPRDFDLNIGGLKAYDYFKDGSFYFVLAPGHAVGHINALARTTENTYIYMAADSFHHLSQLRPHDGAKLPESIELSSCSCTASSFKPIHPVSRPEDVPERFHAAFQHFERSFNAVPFHTISEAEDGQTIAVDIKAARDTITAIQNLDASPEVLVIAAHDNTLFDVIEYLPAEANEWQSKGWKEKGQWEFLADFKETVERAGSDSTK